MAKIGEGDPRWIVDQREDGRNVNSWHWCARFRFAHGGLLTLSRREEKDITSSAKAIFKKLFDDATMVNDTEVSVRITKVRKISGVCPRTKRRSGRQA